MSIETQIKEWTGKGLISEAQANQILEFERTKPKANWALRAFLSLGVFVLSIGLISLIAANWATIPDSLKLVGDFLILGIVAALAFRYFRQGKQLGADITSLFLALFCLASIGLIAQVFHTHGELYEAFLFWNLITLPFLLFSELKLSALLWTSAFFVSGTWWGYDHHIFGQENWYRVFFFFSILPFLSAALVDLTALFEPLRTFRFSFRFAYLASTITFLFVFNIFVYDHHYLILPNTLFHVLLGGSILISLFCLRMKGESLRIQLLRMVVLLVLTALVFIGSKVQTTPFQVASLTIVFCLVSALEASAKKEKGIFNFWTIAVGLRFLILYFEALRTLAMTGLGLILSGFVIIATALLWNKYRTVLFKKAEEWVA
jgi:uncharacterized membrane protein